MRRTREISLALLLMVAARERLAAAAEGGATDPHRRAGSGLREPGVRDTGRVAEMRPPSLPLSLPAATQVQRNLSAPRAREEVRELPVRVHTRDDEAPRATQMDRDLLDQEARPYLTGLRGCRLEVARRRQVALSAVRAGTVRVRWTIEPSGRTSNVEALAPSDTDGEVLRCLSRRMWGWRFQPAPPAPVDVAYTLTLR